MRETAASRRDWGAPPWRVGSFAPPPRLPSRVDVAIIGGGLTGVSAAYHLARAGVQTALFEADRIGSGASGRTGGLVLEGLASGPREGARDCVPRLRELVARLGIECDLQLPGCWEIVHRGDAGLRALPWTDGGASISVARTVPGGVVEPGALTAGLAAAASAAGAFVFEGCRVDPLDPAPALKLKVKDQEVVADRVVVALNAWTLATLPQLAPVQSALTYACLTEPLEENVLAAIGLGERVPFYTADTPYLWGRVCADRSVVFGAGLTMGDPVELEKVNLADAEPAAILTRLERRVKSLHPALGNVRIAARWGGPVAFRERLAPILARHPANDRVFVAGAYAGHGVAFSVHAGALMAAAIIDGSALPPWGSV